MILNINGDKIKDKEGLYTSIREEIGRTRSLGNNLDSLYDFLTEYRGEVIIKLKNIKKLEDNLGAYYEQLMGLLRDLEEEVGLKIYID